MGRKCDGERPKSVDKFYAKGLKVWKTPGKPDKTGVLPPVPVDNCVDSVDFCIPHAVYIHFEHTVYVRWRNIFEGPNAPLTEAHSDLWRRPAN